MHGANTMKKLRKNLNKYEANPAIVWSFIMQETFGEGNPYVAAEAGLEGRDLFLELGNLGKALKDMKGVVNRLEVYNKELEKLNLSGVKHDVGKLGEVINNYYDNIVRPAIKVVEDINDTQTALIEKIEKQREAEKLSRERAALMATPPNDLSPEKKKQQSTQFIDLFSSAVDPSDDVSRQFRQDIEKLIGAIYE
jgi:septation ring formation regulator EzrA